MDDLPEVPARSRYHLATIVVGELRLGLGPKLEAEHEEPQHRMPAARSTSRFLNKTSLG